MKLGQALKEKLMDIRLRDKLLAEGKLNKDQITKALNELKDETDSLTYVEVENLSSRKTPAN